MSNKVNVNRLTARPFMRFFFLMFALIPLMDIGSYLAAWFMPNIPVLWNPMLTWHQLVYAQLLHPMLANMASISLFHGALIIPTGLVIGLAVSMFILLGALYLVRNPFYLGRHELSYTGLVIDDLQREVSQEKPGKLKNFWIRHGNAHSLKQQLIINLLEARRGSNWGPLADSGSMFAAVNKKEKPGLAAAIKYLTKHQKDKQYEGINSDHWKWYMFKEAMLLLIVNPFRGAEFVLSTLHWIYSRIAYNALAAQEKLEPKEQSTFKKGLLKTYLSIGILFNYVLTSLLKPLQLGYDIIAIPISIVVRSLTDWIPNFVIDIATAKPVVEEEEPLIDKNNEASKNQDNNPEEDKEDKKEEESDDEGQKLERKNSKKKNEEVSGQEQTDDKNHRSDEETEKTVEQPVGDSEPVKEDPTNIKSSARPPLERKNTRPLIENPVGELPCVYEELNDQLKEEGTNYGSPLSCNYGSLKQQTPEELQNEAKYLKALELLSEGLLTADEGKTFKETKEEEQVEYLIALREKLGEGEIKRRKEVKEKQKDGRTVSYFETLFSL